MKPFATSNWLQHPLAAGARAGLIRYVVGPTKAHRCQSALDAEILIMGPTKMPTESTVKPPYYYNTYFSETGSVFVMIWKQY